MTDTLGRIGTLAGAPTVGLAPVTLAPGTATATTSAHSGV